MAGTDDASPSQLSSKAMTDEERAAKKKRVLRLLQDAATKAIGAGDPWAKCNMESIPAERVVRHLYHPETEQWFEDETIVKIEPKPFTHGAMRFCYRMKKRAQPPESATNHHFHKHGWAYASNYVAKAYIKNGEIDASDEAKKAVQNDIILQYEAQYWAQRFNASNPPTKIHFIRAYAIEFPDRPGRPWLAVERFIAGTDFYGAGFTKHNTNAGFVDTELRRVTPQVFSAFSFHASHGRRLVADIQGVGDLYTDPQVLSDDYRFGDGDLGPRGMALFFHSFRSCGVSDSMGIPLFPLSKNELKHQAKYEEDEVTLSDEEASYDGVPIDGFQRLDLNRIRRSLALKSPRDLRPPDKKETIRRSNVTSRASVSEVVRNSLARFEPMAVRRTQSDVDEVQACLERAKRDRDFSHRDFHRLESGELRERQFKGLGKNAPERVFHRSNLIRTVSAPMHPTHETKKNLGKVHYQLAVLHGSGRFPEVIPNDDNRNPEDLPSHDAFSVLFHLSHAASLHNTPACLALARVQAGFKSSVSDLLQTIVSTDFETAKALLRRAMVSPDPPTKPKVAAGCLLFQILQDESHFGVNGGVSDTELVQVLQDTLQLFDEMEKEDIDASKHKSSIKRGTGLQVGDRVEADYALEGTYYPAVVESIVGEEVTVCYDDDGSTETLPERSVRLAVPPTATQTSLGGPLSDEEAFGTENTDDSFIFAKYEVKYDLAVLKEKAGESCNASALYEEAADGAMADNKMKTATQWSLKAAELR